MCAIGAARLHTSFNGDAVILIKIAITVLIVTTLSIIAERVSPRVAGILSGYPLGAAIALFFIGIEQGAVFAGESALFTAAGMAALLSFLYFYYLVSIRIKNTVWSMVLASLAGMTAFSVGDIILNALPLPNWGLVIVAAAGVLGFGALFKHIPNASIERRVHLGPLVLLLRASLAALVILVITGAAHLVPPRWAGLFSAFPVNVFPLILILHGTYGPEQAHTVIKNLPTGLWALVLYALTISFAYPRLGVAWGTLIGFFVATLYLLALARWLKR